MTTDTTQRPPTTMPVGGAVTAIIPQSFEEIQRMSNTVIVGGIAPDSLIKWPASTATPEEVHALGRRNVAAVAGVLMAGAELGVPPMAALRMFTSINGKPALYADGNIAVVRKSKDADGVRIAASISSGVEMVYDFGCPYCNKTRKTEDDVREHIDFAHKDQDPTEPAVRILSDRTFGWCESKRADTGETKREEFSIEDAKLAGLWDDKPFKRAKVWRNGKQDWFDDVPNDSTWHRYFKRMLKWRAIGYCLRELYADVLAGMLDEFEAREIEGLIDITPSTPLPPRGRPTPPTPPPAEEDESQDATEEPSDATEEGETASEEGMTLAEVAEQRENEKDGDTGTVVPTNTSDGTAVREEPEGVQHVEEGEAVETGPAQVEVKVAPNFDDAKPPAPPPEDYPQTEGDPVGAFLEQIEETLMVADNFETLTQFWGELEAATELADDVDAMNRADAIYDRHKARIERKLAVANGQQDLLGGGQ